MRRLVTRFCGFVSFQWRAVAKCFRRSASRLKVSILFCCEELVLSYLHPLALYAIETPSIALRPRSWLEKLGLVLSSIITFQPTHPHLSAATCKLLSRQVFVSKFALSLFTHMVAHLQWPIYWICSVWHKMGCFQLLAPHPSRRTEKTMALLCFRQESLKSSHYNILNLILSLVIFLLFAVFAAI